MIPLSIPNLSGREREYLQACIESGFVSSAGPFVPEFEDQLAEYTGSAAVVSTNSGTSGLHLAMHVLGVERDDLVIMPTMTFIASANAISQCGATPLIVDVDPETWLLNASLVESLLETQTYASELGRIHIETGRRVSAIMVVYTNGLVPDMSRFRAIADRFGLILLADAAAAIGARREGKKIGQLTADLSVLSFNGNKTITSGGGGAVVGEDTALVERCRHLSSTARLSRDYEHDAVAFNYRMTNIQAAVGLAQLERVDALISRKKQVRAFYNDSLCDDGWASPFPQLEGLEDPCWLSGITLEGVNVGKLINRLSTEGVEARRFYRPVHLQKPYANVPKVLDASAEILWEKIITLPCSSNISDEDIKFVANKVKSTVASLR